MRLYAQSLRTTEIPYGEAKNKLIGENEKRVLFQRNSNSNNTLGQTAFSATNHEPKCYGCGVNDHIKKHCRKNQLHSQRYIPII